MSAEIVNTTREEGQVQEGIVRREDFGPGHAGNLAFIAVSGGTPCETYIDDAKTKCGQPPIGTVDIDILGDVDPFPYCSGEHAVTLQNQLLEDLHRQGRNSVPGRNGFGRA